MKKLKLFFIIFASFIFTFSVVPDAFSQSQARQITYVKKLSITEGRSYRLYVKGAYTKIKWRSRNRRIAKVSSTGTVRAAKKGITYIAAKMGSHTYSTKVVVNSGNRKSSRKATVVRFAGTGTANVAGNALAAEAGFLRAVSKMKNKIVMNVSDSAATKNPKQFFKELMTYTRQNDEYSYFTLKGCSYSYSVNEGVLHVIVSPQYNITSAQKSASEKKASQIARSVKLHGTSEQKAIQLCTYLSGVEYRRNIQTAYNALNEGVACCQGFSMAYYLLCREAGIQCHILTGTAKTNSGLNAHAWNVVKIGRKWRAIDVTWSSVSPEKPHLASGARLRSHYRDADSIFLCSL